MQFADFTCPQCSYKTTQPAKAVVHHRCPNLPRGAKTPRLVRLVVEPTR